MSNEYIVTDMIDTYQDKCFEELGVEVDDDLGLEVVEKPTIWEKYRVQCDPDKNSFHESLYKQFEQKGYLSPKQVDALR